MNFLNSSIVEVVISIMLIYALLSILVSVLVEWWNHRKKSRGIMLQTAIKQMLNDPFNLQYGVLFFNHHMINSMTSSATKRPPQYISSHMFSDILIDIIIQQLKGEVAIRKVLNDSGEEVNYQATSTNNDTQESDILKLYKKALDEKMNDSPFKELLMSFHQKSCGDYNQLKTLVQQWYNDHMDRVSGWYKTRQKNKFKIAGFAVAIFLNVDSVFLFKVISNDSSLRNNLVEIAENVSDDYSKVGKDHRGNLDSLLLIMQNNVEVYKSGYNTADSSYLDTSKLNGYVAKMEKLVGKLDSAGEKHFNQTKEVIGLAGELGIPIGWNDDYAPLSWIKCVNHDLKFKAWSADEDGEGGVIEYMKYRNNWLTWDNLLLYLLGICITGFSLSFGAPFWFDTLMKLVNIRRAGNKPNSNTNGNSTK